MKKRKRKSLRVPAGLAFVVVAGISGCGSSTTEDAGTRDGGVAMSDAGPRDGGEVRDGGRDAGPVI